MQKAMVKFSIVFYDPGDDVREFEAAYAVFLGMIEKIPNITRRQVVNVMGSPAGRSAFYRILELYFVDNPTMTAALNSEPGQVAGAALYEVFQPKQYRFDTFFADVYEEAGGETPNTDQVEP